MTPPSVGQWRELALAALRRSGSAGEDTAPEQVDELLATATYGGPRIAALHTPQGPAAPPVGVPGGFPYVRGGRASGGLSGGWDVRQRYAEPEPKEVREAALGDLENGATSLWLVLGGGALPVADLAEALDGVHLDLAGVTLDAGDQFAPAAETFFDLLAVRGVDPGRVAGGLGADPLGWQARTGEAGDLRAAAALAGRCAAGAPGLRAVTADATVWHDAGGSEVEELGLATAAGVAYLRALTGAGLSVPEALAQLEFRWAATADQFATIAKLRAARRMWARVAELSGAPSAGGQRQHAVTSAAMMTARDPWVNLLRTTIAAFAAGVGGADAVTVLPFDHRLGRPDGSSRRLARNTQLLLIEEAHTARVLDPAGGSWYVERYTEQLAQAGWEFFTEIERAGGLAAALESGFVADRLAATWEKREARLARRRDPLTGVSEFPNLAERVPQRRAAAEAAGGGLPRHHYAEAFEGLRDRSDAHERATGVRPTVRLVGLGKPAAQGPRVGFATNLFAAGGIAVTTDVAAPASVDPSASDSARRATRSGAGATGPGEGGAAGGGSAAYEIVCLCGPDKAYAEQAEAVAAELRAAGVRRILLAGKGDFAGVDAYIHVGCDAVDALTTTLADLGVAE